MLTEENITKFQQFEDSGGAPFWHLNQTVLGLEIRVSDEDGKPKQKDLDLVNEIFSDLDNIERKSINFIKKHLSVESEFSLVAIEVFPTPDRHEANSTLQFWCDDDGYLYTEVGLLDLSPHYLLTKYF